MSDSPELLLVDDDQSLLTLLGMRLEAEGFRVRRAGSGEQALEELGRKLPALVISDLCMQGMDGMGLFERIGARWPSLPVIILTAHGTVPDAVQAMQNGVFSFLGKPVDRVALLDTIERALAQNPPVNAASNRWCEEIVTRNPQMRELLRQLRLVANSDANILLCGPTGSGKELFARACHSASRRAAGPMIAVNCAAIPADLLESELFGHGKGAFTGAQRDRVGLLQEASGGTLFLDEIGDMPLALQVKLLRVLQDSKVRPVGRNEDIEVDLRVVSATHRDIAEEIAAQRFREDLYYRLNVVTLTLPPLDARREDIPPLIEHFLAAQAARCGRRQRFAPRALEVMVNANWPGNVRQLQNVVAHCCALTPGAVIPAATVRRAIANDVQEPSSLTEAKREFEREYLLRMLRMSNGNVSQAARLAGRNRSDFHKLLARHSIEAAAFRAGVEQDTA
jgi:two-component system response regulator GlrR